MVLTGVGAVTDMTDDPPDTAEKFRVDLLSWGEDNRRKYPWRDLECSLYEVFIAEFFLTQTPADNVAAVYPDFLTRFPTLTHVRDADEEDLEEAIQPLGFQRMRAEALSQIAAEYDALPMDVEALEKLPRVGPYVTNATLCFAREQPLPILDRNVKRVYSRVFGEQFPDSESDQLRFTSQILPTNGPAARRYNLALLDFGALVCTKREPKCTQCFVSEYCTYYQNNLISK
jgi:A/G-specific adenine glycosylase